MDDVAWTTSERNRSVPVVAGQVMRLKNSVNGRKYWRCTNVGCNVTAATEGEVLLWRKNDHAHALDKVAVIRKEAVSEMKKAVQETPHESIQNIHTKIRSQMVGKVRLSEQEQLVRTAIPSYASCKSSLYRKKSESFPGNPQRREDIVLSGDWTRTKTDQNFLLLNDGTVDKILIFGTDLMLKRLCQAEVVMMDGTFKASPSLFSQLYTLHCKVEKKVLPGLYVLLPDKKRETYDRMFRGIILAALNRNMTFNPQVFMTDFEQAVIVSLEANFTQSRIRGCFFHFAQAIWRRVQEQHLVKKFNTDAEFQSYVRRLIAMALVKHEDLDDLWLEIEAESPGTPDFRNMANYFLRTWFDESIALYPRRIWNHGDNTNARTNNDVEGWHNKINRQLKTPHPNLFALIAYFKSEEESNENEIKSMELLHPIRASNKKYRDLEEKHRKLRIQRDTGVKSALQFLDAVKYRFNLV